MLLNSVHPTIKLKIFMYMSPRTRASFRARRKGSEKNWGTYKHTCRNQRDKPIIKLQQLKGDLLVLKNPSYLA